MELEGKIALVSGASRGIGKAIAAVLGKQGATVIGTATSEGGAAAITEALSALNIDGMGVVLDVRSQESVDGCLKNIQQRYGVPAILVNNAGVTRDNLLMRMKIDEWDDVLNTDLTSVYRLTKGVLRGMIKARYGRIINISSVVGSSGNAGQTNYSAAKAGMIGFSKSLAQEIGGRGITVNVVSPGFIDTDMTQVLADEQRKALLADIPLNRLGSVDDIAHAVAFLASDNAGYITGTTLHVNGGMYMS